MPMDAYVRNSANPDVHLNRLKMLIPSHLNEEARRQAEVEQNKAKINAKGLLHYSCKRRLSQTC